MRNNIYNDLCSVTCSITITVDFVKYTQKGWF